jgi:D-Tyr-tRNAtyr deacylase
VIQRVKSASVSVDTELISTIGKGLLVFAGVGKEDTQKEADQVVNKVLKAKFWPDEDGGQVRIMWLEFGLGVNCCRSGRRMSKTLMARSFAV